MTKSSPTPIFHRKTSQSVGRVVVNLQGEARSRWHQVVQNHRSAARALLRGMRHVIRDLGIPLLDKLAPRVFGGLHRVLGGLYADELGELAEGLRVPRGELVLSNLAYEATNATACTAIATMSRDGILLHARNLDWYFPGRLLQRHTILFEFRNAPAGGFTTVGWPGFIGVLTGCASGRFSISVNYAQARSAGGALAALKRAASGYWPVSWLVRTVFENSRDYAAAVGMLRHEPLISPAFFMVVGTKPGEACVIERLPSGNPRSRVRMLGGRPLVQANHFVTPTFADEDETDREDYTDSMERFDAVCSVLRDRGSASPEDLVWALSQKPVLSDLTAHQVLMIPATSRVDVYVP